jgi:hypothetical protein
MRRILSGAIEYPHFGHTVLSAALTFSRLIFCFRGIGIFFLFVDSCEFVPDAPIRFRQTSKYLSDSAAQSFQFANENGRQDGKD